MRYPQNVETFFPVQKNPILTLHKNSTDRQSLYIQSYQIIETRQMLTSLATPANRAALVQM